eukprot:gene683-1138_t
MPPKAGGTAWKGGASGSGQSLRTIQQEEAAKVWGGQEPAAPIAVPPPVAPAVAAEEEGGKDSKSRRKRGKAGKATPLPTGAVEGDDAEVANGGGSMWGNPLPVPKASGAVKSLLQIQQEQLQTVGAALPAPQPIQQPKPGINAWAQAPAGPQSGMPAVVGPGAAAAPKGDGDDVGLFWDSLPQEAQAPEEVGFPSLAAMNAGAARPAWVTAPPTHSSVPYHHPPSTAAEYPTLGGKAGNSAAGSEKASGKSGSSKTTFRQWAESHMSSITGSTDTTLIDFLLTLPSDGEVMEYMGMYLGKSPNVTAYATEFIKRKRQLGVNPSQEAAIFSEVSSVPPGNTAQTQAWQPAATFNNNDDQWEKKKVKSKGKKAAVDPNLLGFQVQSNRIMRGEIDYGEQ